jgi:acetyl esterase/lipase
MKYYLLFLFKIFLYISVQAQDTTAYTNTEIIYGRKDGMALTMVMLQPTKNTNGKAIIKLISGNWVSGYNSVPRAISRSKIYLERGYTVFNVMHGSQPRYSIPDEITDVKRAIRFIRYNAAAYHIDGDRLGITGSSSGGHLSLISALSEDHPDSTSRDPVNRVSARVQAVAVFFPPTDFLNWGSPNTSLLAVKPLMVVAGVASAFEFKEWNAKSGTYNIITDTSKILEIAKKISPINSVSSDDPPVLIIHGDADITVPLQQSQSLVKKLTEAKVPNRLIIKSGGGHGWPNDNVEEKNFVDWFDKYLKVN